MRTLIIAYYWVPWNNAGTFRWINFCKKIKCDVLTSAKPIKSFHDETIPDPNPGRVSRFGSNLPAIVWGFLASVLMQFKKYDQYIITISPESLLLGAWLLQLRGKMVVVDCRDKIDRPHQPNKYMIPVYKFLYRRIKNVIVCYRGMDESKKCIYHGYYEVDMAEGKQLSFYEGRVNHAEYLRRLSNREIPYQLNKPANYPNSSYLTYKHYGFDVGENIHNEMLNVVPKSWDAQTDEMISYLKEIGIEV